MSGLGLGAELVYHGAELVYHGAELVYHGAELVYPPPPMLPDQKDIKVRGRGVLQLHSLTLPSSTTHYVFYLLSNVFFRKASRLPCLLLLQGISSCPPSA